MTKQATLKIEQAQDNLYYMTYTIHDDATGKRCTHTERVHKAECPQNAIVNVSNKAEERGYVVKMDERYTSGY